MLRIKTEVIQSNVLKTKTYQCYATVLEKYLHFNNAYVKIVSYF